MLKKKTNKKTIMVTRRELYLISELCWLFGLPEIKKDRLVLSSSLTKDDLIETRTLSIVVDKRLDKLLAMLEDFKKYCHE